MLTAPITIPKFFGEQKKKKEIENYNINEKTVHLSWRSRRWLLETSKLQSPGAVLNALALSKFPGMKIVKYLCVFIVQVHNC